MEIRISKPFTITPCEPTNAELSLAKSQGRSDGNGSTATKGWTEGWMTVETMDSDGDISRAAGGHHELLLSKGFYQYEHPALAHNIVGRPVSCTVGIEPISGKPGVLSRGYFYLSDPMGAVLFAKSQLLAREEPDDPLARIGMSGEGKSWDFVPYTAEKGGRWDLRKWRYHAIAITSRPKVNEARIPGAPTQEERIYDIACSLNAAEENNVLPQYLEHLVANRALMKSLLNLEPDIRDSDEAHIKYAMETHGLTRSQAMVLVEHTHKLLA